ESIRAEKKGLDEALKMDGNTCGILRDLAFWFPRRTASDGGGMRRGAGFRTTSLLATAAMMSLRDEGIVSEGYIPPDDLISVSDPWEMKGLIDATAPGTKGRRILTNAGAKGLRAAGFTINASCHLGLERERPL